MPARFWAKVDKSGECWTWKAATHYKGYGQFWYKTGMMPAHRIAWEIEVGPIPEGMMIDHLCYTRNCVRPTHLRVVTNKQNSENRSGAQRNSKSGVRGVHWDETRLLWHAQIHALERRIHVGNFPTLEEAEAAVIAARNEVFTHNELDRKAA